MPMHFEARLGSSFDTDSGIVIPEPRVLPATLKDGSAGTEYQYAIFRNEERIGGLGVLGPSKTVVSEGYRERVFTLDLGKEAVIRTVLEFKRIFGNQDEPFSFLRDIAHGLVLAHAGQTTNQSNLRYIAVTSLEALSKAGISGPDQPATSESGQIVLAEAFVPSRSA